MKKLFITSAASFFEVIQYLRFDVRDNNPENDFFTSLVVNKSNELAPYQCFEVDSQNRKEDIQEVIKLLEHYLEHNYK